MVSMAEVIELDLPCDEHAPSTVRQALSGVADEWWALGDAMLVASELVTNAVRHSGCGEHHQIHVRLDLREAEHLVIDVRDPGFTSEKAELRDGSIRGGFGLQLVDQLSVAWGSDRRDDYRVWADVALPAGLLDLPSTA
jgi:anti-sigma regulatory factor (Ser/Thr protein kinase)